MMAIREVEQFEIRNRWTNKVQFTAEITCAPDATVGVKIGLAVRWGYRNGAVLSGAVLSGAVLRGADLRGAVLSGADLRGAVLSGAVLSGAVLRGAVLSGAVLRGAVLSDADLRGAVLRGAVLSGADLRDADLRGAVLSGAVLSGAVLSGAVLRGAVLSDADLRGADLRGAVLSGAPIIPQIHQRVYAAASAPGALDMSNWHKCETTHCRAGWVVTLAGEEGQKLEAKMGTPAAASLIYLASDPNIDRFPSFYGSNADALADMKRLAEEEAASESQSA
jgi:uncharacterized protein YjbI with pentapeptide repeats